jgi:hypothetical protein
MKTRTFERAVKMTIADIANAFRAFMSVRHSRFGYRNQVRGYGKTEYEHQGCPNLWHAWPKWQAKRFPWQAAFIPVPNFVLLLLSDQRLSLYCEECVYIDTCLTA